MDTRRFYEATLTQAETSSQPWRRNRRSVGEFFRNLLEPRMAGESESRSGHAQHRGEDAFDVRHGLRSVLLLLLLLAVFDRQAERAGMLAVEGLFHRDDQRGIAGVIDEHGGPRHRLQRDPVRARAHRQRGDDREVDNEE